MDSNNYPIFPLDLRYPFRHQILFLYSAEKYSEPAKFDGPRIEYPGDLFEFRKSG
jgi:hypothetical protein